MRLVAANLLSTGGPAEPLDTAGGNLRFRGTWVEKHCTTALLKLCTRTKFGDHGFRSAESAAWNSLSSKFHHITDTICSTAMSKLNFSREYIVANFVTAHGCFCKWHYRNPLTIVSITRMTITWVAWWCSGYGIRLVINSG